MGISGVFSAKKKDGTEYFRASVTYSERHISLGSFDTEEAAGAAYALAAWILFGKRVRKASTSDSGAVQRNENIIKYRKKSFEIDDYEKYGYHLDFDKWVVLLNLKKTGMYCKNPIYMFDKYFYYYIERNLALKFDVDDLFFYRTHRIQKRGGHLFYSDYGMQTNLMNHYGIRSFAVKDRDYYFANGDENDFRYGNLQVINRYNGVRKEVYNGRIRFAVKIHLVGELLVGHYKDEKIAAIAYNKAADALEEKEKTSGNYRAWTRNYIEDLSVKEYIHIYESIRFGKNFLKKIST